jgi:hypothetical protein
MYVGVAVSRGALAILKARRDRKVAPLSPYVFPTPSSGYMPIGNVAAVVTVVLAKSRGVWLGAVGAPALLVLLVTVAIVATVLGWSAAVPESFRMPGTLLLLATAALGVAAIVLFQRPVVLPR